MVNEASLTPDGRIELRLRRKTNLEDAKCCCEEECSAPTNDRVDPELEPVRSGAGQLRPTEGPIEIKTHDAHPGEHWDTGKVAKEANESTEECVIKEFDIPHNEKVDSKDGDADDIALHNLAMEIIESWEDPIHKEGENKAKDTDESTNRHY